MFSRMDTICLRKFNAAICGCALISLVSCSGASKSPWEIYAVGSGKRVGSWVPAVTPSLVQCFRQQQEYSIGGGSMNAAAFGLGICSLNSMTIQLDDGAKFTLESTYRGMLPSPVLAMTIENAKKGRPFVSVFSGPSMGVGNCKYTTENCEGTCYIASEMGEEHYIVPLADYLYSGKTGVARAPKNPRPQKDIKLLSSWSSMANSCTKADKPMTYRFAFALSEYTPSKEFLKLAENETFGIRPRE